MYANRLERAYSAALAVPRLADAGQYVASESTMYRLLHKATQMTRRRLERVPRKANLPRALVATRPDQVFC
jgi:putative transposase